jgi:glycosyltransferase involved in cell wall biosynthesis
VAGGAELVAANLAGWLAQLADVEVTVVTTCGPGTNEQPELINGVHVVRYFPPNLWWNFERFQSADSRSPLDKLVWNLRDSWNTSSARKFASILDDIKPDVIHTHNIKGFSPAVWHTAAIRRIPFIHTIHDYNLICRRGTMSKADGSMCSGTCAGCLIPSWWMRRCIQPAYAICSPSRFVLERHSSRGIISAGRGHVIQNGVASPSIAQSRTQHSQPLKLLYLGQLRREKGVHLLAETLGRIPNANLTLTVAGTGELDKNIDQLCVSDHRVAAVGFVRGEQKEQLLASSHALLFPSVWTENSPLVIAEAMSYGLPVIASNLGAIPEFVQHDENGLLFPVSNTEAFAGAISALIDTPGLLSKLSAGARVSSAAWTIPAMGQRYMSLYNSAMRASELP